jgi:hypothetical protein
VFTSPMQRAIQTTINMFKNHPNKDNIDFVILPLVTEAVGFMCDIPIDTYDLIDKFGHGKTHAQGFKFDFSRLY